MAKTSTIEKELKKQLTVAKYAEKRARLKEIIRSPKSTEEQRWEAQMQFQKLPRNASPCRLMRRCRITGRSRGVYQKFGLSRHKLREAAMVGDVPGLKKASW
jgi:small subunit ribosomal protein S14